MDQQELQVSIDVLKTSIDELVITDEETFSLSDDYLTQIKERSNLVNLLFDASIAKQKSALKELTDTKKKFSIPLDSLTKGIQGKQRKYFFDQEEKRKAEQKRLQAEQDKKAEDERLKKLAELEAEKEKLKATGDEKAVEETDQAMDTLFNAPIQTPVVEVKPNVKVDMRSFQKNYRYRIIDIAKVPREYLAVDDKKVKEVMKRDKDKTNISGIEVYYE